MCGSRTQLIPLQTFLLDLVSVPDNHLAFRIQIPPDLRSMKLSQPSRKSFHGSLVAFPDALATLLLVWRNTSDTLQLRLTMFAHLFGKSELPTSRGWCRRISQAIPRRNHQRWQAWLKKEDGSNVDSRLACDTLTMPTSYRVRLEAACAVDTSKGSLRPPGRSRKCTKMSSLSSRADRPQLSLHKRHNSFAKRRQAIIGIWIFNLLTSYDSRLS